MAARSRNRNDSSILDSTYSKIQMFFWNDVLLMHLADSDERKAKLTDLYKNYVLDNNIPFSVQEKTKLDALKGVGDIPEDSFDITSTQIYTDALEIPFLRRKMLYFAQAASYFKRQGGGNSEIPNRLFSDAKIFATNTPWKIFRDSKGVIFGRIKDEFDLTSSVYEKITLNCASSRAIELVWDFKTRTNWQVHIGENRLIEKLGQNTEIVYLSTNGLALRNDFCILESKKMEADGTMIIIGCSVNHKEAPIIPKISRAKMSLIIHMIEPINNTSCNMISIHQVDVSEATAFEKGVYQSEFLLKNFILKTKLIKNFL